MDALSDVLRLVRLTGAVFFDAELSAPWSVHAPPSRQLAAAVSPGAEHLIEYHLVAEGRCWIEVEGEPPLELAEGDLVMVPHGDAHRMASHWPIGAPTLPVSGLHLGDLTPRRAGGGGALTRLVCGYLAIDRRLCAALIESLPRVLRVGVAGSEVQAWLRSYLRLRLADGAVHAPGSDCVLAKLSELMFVEAIRRYAATLPAEQRGWLAALQDRHVGRALALLHAKPLHAWTVESLAREAGTSRSALAERFTALVGKAPMQYLLQWRLKLAAHQLRSGSRPASSVAFEVGYESEAAFNRAFRREFGAPPATWRRMSGGPRGSRAGLASAP